MVYFNTDYISTMADAMQCELTLKKLFVEPDDMVPYLISVCLARSSADSIGDCILSMVRKAARLAV